MKLQQNELYLGRLMRESIFRITALWAFSECALGGLMHAFKLPFTGIFVGGFAVLCVGLLAQMERPAGAQILRATMLVMLVKAVVSPHSPPQAYAAVGFQGFLGALLLGYVRPNTIVAVLYGALAIAESAVQKLLMLYLFFGTSLVEAVDLFVVDVLKKLGLRTDISWAWFIAALYVGVYTLWGAFLGYWIPRMPLLLKARAEQYADLDDTAVSLELAGRRPPFWRKIAALMGILLFVGGTFLLTSAERGAGIQKAIYAVLRTAAVLLTWLFLVRPVLQSLIQRWARKKRKQEEGTLQSLLEDIPLWRQKATQLFVAVSQKYRGARRWVEFALALLAVALYPASVSVRDR